MKTIAYTALISSFLLGAVAHADQNEIGNDFPPPPISTTYELTRDQVRAELEQARANGGIVYADDGYPERVIQSSGAPVSRAQVLRELEEYRTAHRVDGPLEYPHNL
ncbi:MULTISPECIES: DUF4148 domain-containing protein [unclassified Pigmentiphaga]|uniref:DUF4148 domain-containing protein n=1 Tax=unclassified Pigmentiphaga TaxID=2626614 RepID=UPI000B416946|nr:MULTISPECIES: DUF4148 domain-containing protein [unclassified Pigmentiphaga]MBX6318955.1 DUF4148 domain-containing protein [Pigmentiphaga sp.]OVZ54258.1 hypothetical protein CDO44_26250 [Pigmentiphaga sp. NML080357]